MKLTRKDILIMVIISSLFFSIASWRVGLTHTPTTYWNINEKTTINIAFDRIHNLRSLYFLIGSQNHIEISVYAFDEGKWILAASLDEGGYYEWVSVDLHVETDRLSLFFNNAVGEIYEIVPINDSNERVTIKEIENPDFGQDSMKNLVDEQVYFENPPTFLSETYFDEIYFVRSGKEYLDTKEQYEWTHPPLGKLLIALGIQMFSFSPFGWRVMGVIFSSLMIPMIYVLGKVMFETRLAATLAALLLSFDFMHFTMGRIGTVDTYLVFFSLLSLLFFYLNWVQMLADGGKIKIKFIFFGVLFFSLAFAVKWTAVYGLAGQIILILAYYFRDAPSSVDEFKTKFKEFLKPLGVILGCLFIGGLVYLSTYIPYLLSGHSLNDLYNLQWSMFFYHSQLTATHPYSSEWWMWPLNLKPVWLYYKELPGGVVSTITAMGNPVLWLCGFPIILLALWKGVKERSIAFLFLGAIYMSQWLPYLLIPRCLFLYHYYPNVPILALASAGVLNESWNKPKHRKLVITYIILTVSLFIIFYPIISGYPIPDVYSEILRWFNSWVL